MEDNHSCKISKLTHQFDDLDEHPVISGGGHEFEEDWCETKVVLGVLACQFTDDVDSRRLHTRIWVLQLLLEAGEGRS